MKTTTAFVITLIALTAGMVFTTFYTSAPYTAFATTVGIVFSALAGKKLLQKHQRFDGYKGDVNGLKKNS